MFSVRLRQIMSIYNQILHKFNMYLFFSAVNDLKPELFSVNGNSLRKNRTHRHQGELFSLFSHLLVCYYGYKPS